MKLKFKRQDFQTDAVGAVADLFTGQEKRTSIFSIVRDDQLRLVENEYRLCKGHPLLYRNPAYPLCTDPELPIDPFRKHTCGDGK